MADKASRGLVIYGDGLARLVDPTHTHIHKLASLSCCGFLSLPHSPSSESEDARVMREFAQLLDVGDTCMDMSGEGTTNDVTSENLSSVKSISDRFMGMRAAMLTDSTSLKSFGGKYGLSVLQLQDLIDKNKASTQPSHDVLASELLKLLGFQEGKVLDASPFDLVFLHIGTYKEMFGQKDIEFLNSLLGGLMQIAPLGSDIGSRLHLSLVLGYGDISQDDPNLSVSVTNQSSNSKFSSLFPRQSYSLKGMDLRTDVRPHCPLLMAQWQSGVTRKDTVKNFFFQELKEHCGNLTVPADRFLHEVAFKLWKAPKYGA
ncbi:uncharacterized protein LOC141672772 [Apium graveolens]|uniref:uncharacterized protein LOC141672772 n=1 Tax=Apium graveolens TaxID=4045 RepID=UPI003D795FF8